MAFVTPDLAESIQISNPDDTDASNATESNLNDGDTGSEASGEIRNGMSAYKITHDLGFAVSNLDSLSIRVFDGNMMDVDDMVVYPYSAGDADVVTGNEGTVAIIDNGDWDTLALSAGFISDLEDVGTNQISIRFCWASSSNIRGRFTEIELEFAQAGTPARRVMIID